MTSRTFLPSQAITTRIQQQQQLVEKSNGKADSKYCVDKGAVFFINGIYLPTKPTALSNLENLINVQTIYSEASRGNLSFSFAFSMTHVI